MDIDEEYYSKLSRVGGCLLLSLAVSLNHGKSLLVLVGHLDVPLLLVEVDQSLNHALIVILLLQTLLQMELHLTPVSHLCIDIHHLQPLLQVLRSLLEHGFEEVEGFVGFASDQQDIGQVVHATDVIRIFL